MLLSATDAGDAITQVTMDAQHNTIHIPAGKGGWLKAVELQICPTSETVVNAGGHVRLWNSSADWDPFYFVTSLWTVVTEGGGSEMRPVRYAVNKELPGNSYVYGDFRPDDNQSQHLKLTLIWELGGKPDRETFSGYIHPLFAAAVSATARASPGNYLVPGGKGGRIVYIVDQCWPTLEDSVNSGGLRELTNNAYDMTPCESYTVAGTVEGASGGGCLHPHFTPWDGPCPQNSTFTTYYTPTDDQAQTLSTYIFWERPIRRLVS
jgi:hypothetical protein